MTLLLASLGAMLTARWWLLVIGAAVHLRRRPEALPEAVPLDVALLIPAFNEARVLEGTVLSALQSDHLRLTVLIIDDGSSDGTAEIATRLADEHRQVQALILPHNVGKAEALNAGLAATDAAVLVTVDADTVLAPCAIRAFAHRMADPDIAAVAGNVKVGNRGAALTRWQNIEYVTALHVDRRALDVLGCVTTVPGAAGAWRRTAVLAVGGWSHDTRTEDTDLTLALLRTHREIVFEPRARAWTEAPQSLGDLFRQRTRWMFGYLQCLAKHRRAFFTPNALGLVGMPNLLFSHLLVFLLPIPGWWVGELAIDAAGPGVLVAAALTFLAGELGLSSLAYLADGEDLWDLVEVPAQRLFWPVLLYATFAHVWFRVLTLRAVPWWSPTRQGQLADHSAAGGSGAIR